MNLNSVIEKIKSLKGITHQKDLAIALGISPQDFSNRKKVGTLAAVIFEWAIHENVNLSWLFGQDNNDAVAVSDFCLPYNQQQPNDPQIREMVLIMRDLDKQARSDLLRQAKKELELKLLKLNNQVKSEVIDALEPRTFEQQRKLKSKEEPVAEKPKERKSTITIKQKKDLR